MKQKTQQKYQVYSCVDGLPYFLPQKEVYIPTFLKKTGDIVIKALQGIGLANVKKITSVSTDVYTDDEVIWLWINNELSFELRLIAEVLCETADNNPHMQGTK